MEEQVLAESKRGILGWICLALFIAAVSLVIFTAIIGGDIPTILLCVIIFIGPTGLLALLTSPVKLTVTTERIYGTGAWGKKINLPVDMISSVGSNFLGGITIGTSSGKTKFIGLAHKRDILHCINDLLLVRQKMRTTAAQPQMTPPASAADELMKYKNLLDSGIRYNKLRK